MHKLGLACTFKGSSTRTRIYAPHTLSAPVAWLIAEGVRPERILLLTFTRRAAAAMITRTHALLERTDAAPRAAVVAGRVYVVG